jgi:hypothetical protein
MLGYEPDGLARLCQQLSHFVRVERRAQPGEALGTHRRQRQAFDQVDDTVEFEGPQGARLHEGKP